MLVDKERKLREKNKRIQFTAGVRSGQDRGTEDRDEIMGSILPAGTPCCKDEEFVGIRASTYSTQNAKVKHRGYESWYLLFSDYVRSGSP